MDDEEVREPGVGEVISGLPDEGSLLDALSAQRDEAASTRETYIPIPGYDGSGWLLFALYHLVDGDDMAKIGKKVASQFSKKQDYERQLYASIDSMIEACDGIFVASVNAPKEMKPLTLNGIPIEGFTMELAECLRFSDKVAGGKQQARSIVINMFGGNVFAIQQHNMMLGLWMGNTTRDVAGEWLEGNS